MSRSRCIISSILLLAVVAYLIFVPNIIDGALGREYYREWLKPIKEDFSGTISVWHIVGFKPYVGSLGNWLKSRAEYVEKEHFGVYFEVTSMTEDDAMALIGSGKRPDVFSIPLGWCPGDGLRELSASDAKIDLSSGIDNGSLKAMPYAASGKLLIYNPVKVTPVPGEIERLGPGSIEDFKSGKADCCTADVRAAGDLYRAAISGKVDPFEAIAYSNETTLVQYLCIDSTIDAVKLPYVRAFIEDVASVTAQESLCELGLMPMNQEVKLKYDKPFLTELYEKLRANPSGIPNTFDYWHSREI